MPTYSGSSATLSVNVNYLTVPTHIEIALPAAIYEETPCTVSAYLYDVNNVGIVGEPMELHVYDEGAETPVIYTALTFTGGRATFNGVVWKNPGTSCIAMAVYPVAGLDLPYGGSYKSVYVTVLELVFATSLTLSVTTLDPVVEDIPRNFRAKLTSNGVGLVGNVNLYVNDVLAATRLTDADGYAIFSVTFPDPGTYTLRASFAGLTTTL